MQCQEWGGGVVVHDSVMDTSFLLIVFAQEMWRHKYKVMEQSTRFEAIKHIKNVYGEYWKV